MKFLDVGIGLIAGYFVYTESGRQEAIKGVQTGMKMASKYADAYLKPLIPQLPLETDLMEEKVVEEVEE